MKPPAGSGLLLTGSGIYWILSSQLIASYTVLMPELFRGIPTGAALVLVTGVFASSVGLWTINVDLDELHSLFSRKDGWVFTIPLMLVSLDVSLTIGGLTYVSGIVELNPFVSAVVQEGRATLAAFLIAYMALSQGVALLAVTAGAISIQQKNRGVPSLLSSLRSSIIRPPKQPLSAGGFRSGLEYPSCGGTGRTTIRDLGLQQAPLLLGSLVP